MAKENVQYVEEQGITLGEIFKRIWKAKLVLGITGVTTCAVALLGVFQGFQVFYFCSDYFYNSSFFQRNEFNNLF